MFITLAVPDASEIISRTLLKTVVVSPSCMCDYVRESERERVRAWSRGNSRTKPILSTMNAFLAQGPILQKIIFRL